MARKRNTNNTSPSDTKSQGQAPQPSLESKIQLARASVAAALATKSGPPQPPLATFDTGDSHGKQPPLAAIDASEPHGEHPPPATVTIGKSHSKPPPAPTQTPTRHINLRSRTIVISGSSLQHKPSKKPLRYRDALEFSTAIPVPSAQYMEHITSTPPVPLPLPQRLLLILDLNGVLIFRKSGASPRSFRPRPGLAAFLQYCFAHHAVLLWTSAKRANALAIVERLLEPEQRAALVGLWTREDCRLTPTAFARRTQVYKRLEWVWGSREVNPGGKWGSRNTLLLDDSVLKGAGEPWNMLLVKEWEGDEGEVGELERVRGLVEGAAGWDDVGRWNYWRQEGGGEVGVDHVVDKMKGLAVEEKPTKSEV